MTRTWITGNTPHRLPETATVVGDLYTCDDRLILGGIYDHDITTRDDWPEFVRSIEAEYGLTIKLPGEAQ